MSEVFMENIEEILLSYTKQLNALEEELNLLEREKQEIIKAYQGADDKSRKKIEKQMKESEKSFEILLKEVLALSSKIRKLKNMYC